MQKAIDLGSLDNFPKRDVMYAIEVIKENEINGDKELFIGLGGLDDCILSDEAAKLPNFLEEINPDMQNNIFFDINVQFEL